ncbi:hypothetical protein [Streptomyces hygroscopicus]|uniref:hypothetical protein n=1 Tax=Streptomyces hygroscopicus TaxID=1912 RepID=UPI0007825780|nr:hypothetical protein [Streptomyces hygroscopicus]
MAPLLATVVTLPLTFFLTIGVMLSPMECDPCTGATLSRFTHSFNIAWRVYIYGLVVPAGMLLTAWALPRRRRHTPLRTTLAALTPCSVVFLYLVFSSILESPSF